MTALDALPLSRDRDDAVFGTLNGLGVPWCLLRRPRDDSDDLDLLVSARDLDEVTEALATLGLVEEPAFGRGSHRFLIGLEARDSRGFSRVDLVTSLDFGPLLGWSSGMAETCLTRAVTIDGIAFLNPVDEFWVTALHLLADDGVRAADPHRWHELAQLAASVAGRAEHTDWLAAADRVPPCSEVVTEQVARLVADPEAGPPADLSSVRRSVRHGCLATLRTAPGRRRLSAHAWGRATEPTRQWRGRRGLLVAVLGPDGAGKSTLLAGLAEDWPWPHRRVYFGLWPDVRNPSTLSSVGWPLRRPFRAVSRYLRGWLAGCRGRLVLFDRYVYDAAAPPRGAHLRLKRIYFAGLLRCVPAPDLVLLLDAPGEVLFARKGEMTPATLDDHRAAVSGHVHRLSARRGRPRVVVLDATQTAAAVRDQAVAAIWAPAADRLTRRGGRAT